MNASSLLKWYAEAGVDEIISDTPQNRLGQREARQEVVTPISAPPKIEAVKKAPMPAPAAPQAPHAAQNSARALADRCTTRDELEQTVRAFEGLAIKKTATNTVFSDGNPKARIMFIGEAPGSNEDLKGIPFCGASGMLLDKMLKSIELERATNAYISNTIFWRPPGNRNPTPEELNICRPFVEKHVALINPALLVLVGGIATSAVLGKEIGISKLRGKTYSYTNQYMEHEIPVAVTYHPSYLLRSPGQKKLAWQDMLYIKHLLKNLL